MKKKKLLTVFGTRPEAIKLAPFILKVRQQPENYDLVVCVTAQHREMLDDVLKVFDIKPEYDFNIMIPGQDLFHVVTESLSQFRTVLQKENPDLVVVQGDTSSTFIGALGAYYRRIPIAHIEAGLRTGDKYSPFPEEKNRHLVSCLADLHFAPTDVSKNNLLREGIATSSIHVVGNTVIDALLNIKERLAFKKPSDFGSLFSTIDWSKKLLLVTGHRRENFGDGIENICYALRDIVDNHSDVQVVYAVHLNPNIQEPVNKIIGAHKQIRLLPPLSYTAFVYLMNKSYLVLTDSGGIQEEAPALGKPVLVIRNTTERPEAVSAGTAKLVGTNRETIFKETNELLTNLTSYKKMNKAINPYGDGQSCEKIMNVINHFMSFYGND